MLEDFIQANHLKAKIVQLNAHKTLSEQLKEKNISFNSLIECKLFLDPEKNEFLFIHFKKEKILHEKISNLIEADETECWEITGYEKGFLPPISIYGVKVLIDESVFKKEKVFCRTNPNELLEIPVKEILEANEEMEKEKLAE